MKTTSDEYPTAHPSFGVGLGVIPFERSYAVVPGRLLAGLYPASDDPLETTEKLRRLLAVGVSHVVNLTEPSEANYGGVMLVDYATELTALAAEQVKKIACRRFPIRDLDVPTVERMQLILDDIDGAVGGGRKTYLHTSTSTTSATSTSTVPSGVAERPTCIAGAVGAGPAPWWGVTWPGTAWRSGTRRWRWSDTCAVPI